MGKLNILQHKRYWMEDLGRIISSMVILFLSNLILPHTSSFQPFSIYLPNPHLCHLSHPSWHVYSAENREKVRKDEEAFQLKQDKLQARSQQAVRIQFLFPVPILSPTFPLRPWGGWILETPSLPVNSNESSWLAFSPIPDSLFIPLGTRIPIESTSLKSFK